MILNKQRWLTTSKVPSRNYFKPMQWFASICSSLVNGFKPGILCSLQRVHFYQNMSGLCLWYSYVFNTVHLVHTINWIHWQKMHRMDNFKINDALQAKMINCCVVDTQFFFFVVVLFLLFLALLYVLYVSHKLNFITLSSHLFVTHTICLHFHFLVSRPGMGGI